jgi:hypothetical protein
MTRDDLVTQLAAIERKLGDRITVVRTSSTRMAASSSASIEARSTHHATRISASRIPRRATMSEQHIQHVWEFRAGCHNADDVHAQPCACASCTAKRRAAVAEQPELDDDAYVQFVGDKTRYSVCELRAAEAVSVDQAHEDIVPLPPDPWGPGLAAMRAASATPPPTFEDKWKADRLAALAIEHAKIDAHIAVHPSPPRLTTAELKTYAPPNPYEAGIKALQAKKAK